MSKVASTVDLSTLSLTDLLISSIKPANVTGSKSDSFEKIAQEYRAKAESTQAQKKTDTRQDIGFSTGNTETSSSENVSKIQEENVAAGKVTEKDSSSSNGSSEKSDTTSKAAEAPKTESKATTENSEAPATDRKDSATKTASNNTKTEATSQATTNTATNAALSSQSSSAAFSVTMSLKDDVPVATAAQNNDAALQGAKKKNQSLIDDAFLAEKTSEGEAEVALDIATVDNNVDDGTRAALSELNRRNMDALTRIIRSMINESTDPTTDTPVVEESFKPPVQELNKDKVVQNQPHQNGASTQAHSSNLKNESAVTPMASTQNAAAASESNLAAHNFGGADKVAAKIADAPAPVSQAGSKADTSGTVKTAPAFLKTGSDIASRIEHAQAILQRAADSLVRLSKSGGGRTVIHLRPETLGRIRLEVTVENSVANAQLYTENPQVRSLIVHDIAQLREALSEHGISLGQFDVNDGRPEGNMTGWFDGSPKNGQNTAAPTTIPETRKTTESAETRPTQKKRTHAGLIHVTA